MSTLLGLKLFIAAFACTNELDTVVVAVESEPLEEPLALPLALPLPLAEPDAEPNCK